MPRSLCKDLVLLLMLCGATFAAAAKGLWIDVPFVSQQKDGCGPASIAMVMQYWQQHLGQPSNSKSDYAQIDRALSSPEAHGIYASTMEHYFQQNGYRTFAFSGQWSDLQNHLAKGRPLIAALQPGKGLPLHYVVVVGVEKDEHVVLLNDPAQRKLLKEDDAQFAREWKAAGNWTLLAVPEQATHP